MPKTIFMMVLMAVSGCVSWVGYGYADLQGLVPRQRDLPVKRKEGCNGKSRKHQSTCMSACQAGPTLRLGRCVPHMVLTILRSAACRW